MQRVRVVIGSSVPNAYTQVLEPRSHLRKQSLQRWSSKMAVFDPDTTSEVGEVGWVGVEAAADGFGLLGGTDDDGVVKVRQSELVDDSRDEEYCVFGIVGSTGEEVGRGDVEIREEDIGGDVEVMVEDGVEDLVGELEGAHDGS